MPTTKRLPLTHIHAHDEGMGGELGLPFVGLWRGVGFRSSSNVKRLAHRRVDPSQKPDDREWAAKAASRLSRPSRPRSGWSLTTIIQCIDYAARALARAPQTPRSGKSETTRGWTSVRAVRPPISRPQISGGGMGLSKNGSLPVRFSLGLLLQPCAPPWSASVDSTTPDQSSDPDESILKAAGGSSNTESSHMSPNWRVSGWTSPESELAMPRKSRGMANRHRSTVVVVMNQNRKTIDYRCPFPPFNDVETQWMNNRRRLTQLDCS